VIVAAASAAVLSHLRGLIDLNDRVREHQRRVSSLLSQVALLQAHDLAQAQLAIKADAARLSVPGLPLDIEVTNFTADGRDVPPIDQAYTPFQRFALGEERHRMTVVLPGLRPPR